MAAPTLPPAPTDTPLTKDDGRPSSTWARWFQLLGSNLKTQTFSQTITVPDDWIYVGAGGAPAFENSWVNFDAVGWTPASFRKIHTGMVQIRGLVRSGTIGATIFTIPAAYRPAISVGPFATITNTGFGGLQLIAAAGIIQSVSGGNGYFNIDCTFEASDRTPIIPSCFPFDVASSLQGEATWLEVARVRETGTGADVSPGVVHWEPVESGGTRYHRIKNIPGLTPNKTYEITFVAGAS